ncbi:hypothetical protein CVT24_003771 [Panaeolus cyanescens]|uniref:Lysine-specific metallo-endopeptidase domain-containing protein n=1 Tax=Panaeolus cyanescens TaxID=181874 RepID=A0A409WC64_9AGAR|nr:hypothetical protein CVT24_003771 [Panaeolus cyanescens]
MKLIAHPVVIFTTIVALRSYTQAFSPDLSILKVNGVHENGEQIRGPGEWHDPTVHDRVWPIARAELSCLVEALQNYYSTEPEWAPQKRLLDYYYGINHDSDTIYPEVVAQIQSLYSAQLRFIGDNVSPSASQRATIAQISRIKQNGRKIKGVNLFAAFYTGSSVDDMRRVNALIHEGTHYVFKSNDYWIIKRPRRDANGVRGRDQYYECTPLSKDEFRSLEERRARDIYCAYWSRRCEEGMRKLMAKCYPFARLATADITVAAAHHCYTGRELTLDR